MDVVGPQLGFHDDPQPWLYLIKKTRGRPRQVVGQVAMLNRGSLANSALIRSEPVGVMQVTVIGNCGYCTSSERIIGAAAMLSPTDTACTQMPPRCMTGKPRAQRSPM
ncbi:hypothetical protein PSYJA_32031, partial [Pseudomonas syringae pv. japonica str. M301072]